MRRSLATVTLLTLLVGCGGNERAHDDDDGGAVGGSGGEGGAGGGAVQPQSATVTVVDRWGTTLVGIDVVGHDSAGAVLQQAKTDAQGKASVKVSDGGIVTALWSQTGASDPAPAHFAVSRSDVDPGGAVLIPIDLTQAPPAPRMTVNVSKQSLPSSTAAAYLYLSCLGPVKLEDTITSLSYGGCAGSDTFDAIALAFDGEGKLRGAMTWQDEPISEGLTTTFTLLSVAFSTAPASLQLDVPGLPLAQGFNAFLTSVVLTSHAPDGAWASTSSSTIQWVVPKLVPPFGFTGGNFDVSVSIWNGQDQAYGYRERRADFSTGLFYPFRDIPMPQIESSDLMTARPQISYVLPAGAELGDAISTAIDWGVPPVTPVNRWVLHAPAAPQGAVVLPELPESLADWRPEPPMRASVLHSDMDGVSDLDALLAKQTEASWYVNDAAATVQ